MYILHVNLLRTASSKSKGLFVAPISTTLSDFPELTPSNCIKNSVFNLLVASFSPPLLFPNIESISSMNITEGCLVVEIAKSAYISFSLSPNHLVVIVAALMLKNVISVH